MTTVDGNPTLFQFMAWKLGKVMSDRVDKKSKIATQARTWIQVTMRLVLHVAGFACLTYAAFKWSTIAGWTGAGISCFLLSWLLTSTPAPQTQGTADPRR